MRRPFINESKNPSFLRTFYCSQGLATEETAAVREFLVRREDLRKKRNHLIQKEKRKIEEDKMVLHQLILAKMPKDDKGAVKLNRLNRLKLAVPTVSIEGAQMTRREYLELTMKENKVQEYEGRQINGMSFVYPKLYQEINRCVLNPDDRIAVEMKKQRRMQQVRLSLKSYLMKIHALRLDIRLVLTFNRRYRVA